MSHIPACGLLLGGYVKRLQALNLRLRCVDGRRRLPTIRRRAEQQRLFAPGLLREQGVVPALRSCEFAHVASEYLLFSMKEKAMLNRIAAVVSLFCLMLPAAAFAQGFTQGDRTLSLGGSGASDNEFVDNSFTFEGELGYFFTDAWEMALRQGLAFNNASGSDDEWAAATRVALDYNFDMGRWWPLVGASLGYIYGDAVSDTWVAGPEAGVRYFVNETTFITGLVEYEFFFDDADEATDAFDDGRFVNGFTTLLHLCHRMFRNAAASSVVRMGQRSGA
jgi:hypothetical protein